MFKPGDIVLTKSGITVEILFVDERFRQPIIGVTVFPIGDTYHYGNVLQWDKNGRFDLLNEHNDDLDLLPMENNSGNNA